MNIGTGTEWFIFAVFGSGSSGFAYKVKRSDSDTIHMQINHAFSFDIDVGDSGLK